ncbi:hypothetical protein EIP86_003102 [Pleurotus ostreatoroseus]|nr:hypothetical protein EIP86_003102 [Pleurotus ostreatoroseus]
MATKWMRAALASSSVLLRASRPGLAHPPLARLSALRWSSSEAAQLDPALAERSAPTKPADLEASAINNTMPHFSTLEDKINPHILKALTVKPFKLTHMSAVQAQVLPLLPDLVTPYNPEKPNPHRKDLLVKAKTGTGKTIGFLVPAVESRLKEIDRVGKQAVLDAGLVSDSTLELKARKVHARTSAGCLIISPTRELATQIANEALRLTSGIPQLETRLFVGGVSKRGQMRDWMRGRRDIVVATPGRIRDMLETEPEVAKGLKDCPMLILDEADTLLEMGFREEISAITEFLPKTPNRQTFLFSATVSREIQQVARELLDRNHQFINCVSEDDSPVHAHVPQYHTVLPSAGHQVPHVLRLLAHDQLTNPGCSKTIIFLNTTKQTQLFSTFFRELRTLLPAGKKTRIYEIHSKRAQESRTRTSDEFRADKSGASVLVSSDVSARGVDYPGVTRVIQLGIPGGTDQYIHRVGRTGRGKDRYGRADLVLLPWEVGFVTWQLTDIPLKPLTVNELTNQVQALSAQLAENPRAFPSAFSKDYTTTLAAYEREIRNLTEQLDEEAVKETLASLLGYYFGKYHELRVQKNVVYEGLRDWTVEACGLEKPPYISPGFLQRLGMDDNRTKHYGSGTKKYGVQDNKERNRWSGRGNVRAREERARDPYYGERSSFGVGAPRLDSRDPGGMPEEYRSQRYRHKRY